MRAQTSHGITKVTGLTGATVGACESETHEIGVQMKGFPMEDSLPDSG